MIKPIDQFALHASELKKLNDIYKHNSLTLSPGIDIDGLLRSEIVFIVSALDQYIHQVVLHKLNDILLNGRSSPVSFSKLVLGLDSLNNILSIISGNNISDAIPIIEQDIKVKLSWRSFQQPDKINEALRMVSDKNIWNEVAVIANRSCSDIKEQLSLIVKRRDCIAHEADFDPVSMCQYPINSAMTTDAVNFIITITYMLDSVVFDYAFSPVVLNNKLI